MRVAIQTLKAAPAPASFLAAPSHAIQRKATIGPIDDPLEREADRVADAVMGGGSAGAFGAAPAAIAQRTCAACEAEEEKIQRKSAPCEVGEHIQRKPAEAAASAVGDGGAPLAPEARTYFEPRFGRDFSDVRVHTHGRAASAANAIHARAYTLGSNIAFAPGEFLPQSQSGRRLLAHELVHVAQQVRYGQTIQRAPTGSPVAAPAVSSILLTIQRVMLIMCRNSRMREAFEMIDRDGVQLVGFKTGLDTWRYDDGRVEEVPITGLRGNTDVANRTIRLNEALPAQTMAETLFHELQHWAHNRDPAGPRGLESEIQARIATEQLAIERGRPPTGPGYRTADGRVDEAAIRRAMASSSHYSPVGRQRIGRRYEGETPIPGPLVCPPIGDFPEPSRERVFA
ncbi:eCIS core domain-containing protein [Mesorhizobium sp. LjNodule214]|uniref:eCIS core domain-containing protein n=1 Tax=Mesorhizobium sp. LjNodule214 TaxID=3342252 RepID=UPI003ECF03AA